jgi:Spy/CpxP family protein refolding chaperone
MGMRERMEPAKMEAYMLKRAAELKAKLKLTASQEGAWTTFAAAMKPPARPTANLPERAELDKLSTPERIDKMHALRVQRTTEINAAMDKRDEAVKTFYAALTPEQQKVFDAEHARVGAQRWQGRGRGPGGPGTASASDAPAKK